MRRPFIRKSIAESLEKGQTLRGPFFEQNQMSAPQRVAPPVEDDDDDDEEEAPAPKVPNDDADAGSCFPVGGHRLRLKIAKWPYSLSPRTYTRQ